MASSRQYPAYKFSVYELDNNIVKESSQQELDEPDLEKRRILISLEGSTEFDNLRYGSYLTMTKLI